MVLVSNKRCVRGFVLQKFTRIVKWIRRRYTPKKTAVLQNGSDAPATRCVPPLFWYEKLVVSIRVLCILVLMHNPNQKGDTVKIGYARVSRPGMSKRVVSGKGSILQSQVEQQT